MQKTVFYLYGRRVEEQMNKIVYDIQLIKIMSLFESITHVELKDCIKEDGNFVFIVNSNDIGKAVGARAKNVRALETALRARIKIVEFNTDPVSFIKNLIYPLQTADVQSVDGAIVMTAPDGKTRSMLIGRNATRLRSFEAIVQRYFQIKELRVN